jgi:hypothetical protein
MPVYVGKCKDLSRRLSHHKWRLNNPNLMIEELDVVSIEDWKFWEIHYISLFKSWGFKLENKNNGGGGLTKHNNNSVEASRIKRKGQKRPNTSLKLKGKPLSEERKKKIGDSNRKPKPEGFGEMIKGKLQNKKQSVESNQKRRIKHLGIPKPGVSEFHKGRISPNKGYLGKNRSEEFKLNNSTIKSKPVLQYDLEGNFIKEFKSQTEAALFVNKPKGMAAINECMRGKRKTAYKFIWKNKN